MLLKIGQNLAMLVIIPMIMIVVAVLVIGYSLQVLLSLGVMYAYFLFISLPVRYIAEVRKAFKVSKLKRFLNYVQTTT